ncbi:MAG: transcription termination factor Rho [Kineosporiaceae bacterium]
MTDTSEIAPAEPAARSGGSRAGSLSSLRLPELQAVAAQLGISGTARMRKSDLIAAITARQNGGADSGSAPGAAPSAAPEAASAPSSAATAATAAPRGRRRAGAPAGPPTPRDGDEAPQQALPLGVENGARPERPVDERGGPAVTLVREQAAPDRAGGPPEALERATETSADGFRADRDGSRRDNRRQRDGQARDGQPRDGQARDGQARDGQVRDGQGDQQGQPAGRQFRDDDEDDGGDGRGRRRRGRYRDRKRRGRDGSPAAAGVVSDEPEVGEDDVLVPVAGILDVLDNYAFVRTSGYLPGPNDVYVSLGQVKRYGLRKGDAVVGAVRAQRESDQQTRQQKFNALVRLDTINGTTPDDARVRPEFGKLTPLYPQERLRLETEPNMLTTRLIDLVAPIGKGQRGLIVSPSKAGKTLVMQAIANAITRNNPECHLMVVLVDERPEEVTDMQRAVKGEVIASTFDRPADDHTTVAELAIERAKRLVELGHDVVVLLDSITRLGRAYNLAAPASGRILSGGVDSSALYPPKRFFGAARNIENGGSLTIMATALIETGSKMDEVIFEEFKGTGNMELRLSRQLADRRIFPAIDVNASGTRREEILMSKEELNIVWKLRRVMGALEPQQAIELLLDRVKQTRSNVEFLMQVQKTTPVPGRGSDDD